MYVYEYGMRCQLWSILVVKEDERSSAERGKNKAPGAEPRVSGHSDL